jgi:hypothetical protein
MLAAYHHPVFTGFSQGAGIRLLAPPLIESCGRVIKRNRYSSSLQAINTGI